MSSDAVVIVGSAEKPEFHSGDEVDLAETQHQSVRGVVRALSENGEWNCLEKTGGVFNARGVEWMLSPEGPSSYSSLTGRQKD